MSIQQTHFEKKLFVLERMRRDIANKLDKSYLQNNVSDLLALEEKYEIIILQINKIQTLLANRNRISTSI